MGSSKQLSAMVGLLEDEGQLCATQGNVKGFPLWE